MKVGNEIFGVVEFRGGKPRKLIIGIFITEPSDKVE